MNIGFLNELLNSIAGQGRSLVDKAFGLTGGVKTLDRMPLPDLARLLLSSRGEASGVAIAREIISRYQAAAKPERITFLTTLADAFAADPAAIRQAFPASDAEPNAVTHQALLHAVDPPRQEVLAVFRDLVTMGWPVVYSSPERGSITMLVYNVGHWLPAALAGRILGWGVANFILFLWTWFGVLLTVLHLNLKLKTSLVKSALLLIFFSGLDVIGTLLFAKDYPTLWPPVPHLEIWSGGDMQYSSFTTQLFWCSSSCPCMAVYCADPVNGPQ